MNLTKKNMQKTSGIHRLGKFYKPGQLITIDRQWNTFYTECKR